MRRLLLLFDNIQFMGINVLTQTFPFILLPALLNVKIRGKVNVFLLAEFFLFVYGLIISIIYMLSDAAYSQNGFIRQTISYALGLIIFSYFLRNKNFFNQKYLATNINLCVLLIMPLVLYQVFILGHRAQGFSNEPSHLGDVLVLVVFPFIFLSWTENKFNFPALLLCFIFLIMTFSMTSYLKFAIFIFVYLLMRNFLLICLFISTIYLFGYLILVSDADFYIIKMFHNDFNALITLQLASFSGSFVDRFILLLMLFDMQTDIRLLFGGGFGCELSCFFPLIDQDLASIIKSVKSDPPTLSPFYAKQIFYFGIVPVTIVAFLYFKRLIHLRKRGRVNNIEVSIFITVSVSALFSIGPFWLPYIWMWKAYMLKK